MIVFDIYMYQEERWWQTDQVNPYSAVVYIRLDVTGQLIVDQLMMWCANEPLMVKCKQLIETLQFQTVFCLDEHNVQVIHSEHGARQTGSIKHTSDMLYVPYMIPPAVKCFWKCMTRFHRPHFTLWNHLLKRWGSVGRIISEGTPYWTTAAKFGQRGEISSLRDTGIWFLWLSKTHNQTRALKGQAPTLTNAYRTHTHVDHAPRDLSHTDTVAVPLWH